MTTELAKSARVLLRFKKERKFYFTDPLIFRIAQKLSGKITAEDQLAKVAEMVAH